MEIPPFFFVSFNFQFASSLKDFEKVKAMYPPNQTVETQSQGEIKQTSSQHMKEHVSG